MIVDQELCVAILGTKPFDMKYEEWDIFEEKDWKSYQALFGQFSVVEHFLRIHHSKYFEKVGRFVLG